MLQVMLHATRVCENGSRSEVLHEHSWKDFQASLSLPITFHVTLKSFMRLAFSLQEYSSNAFFPLN